MASVQATIDLIVRGSGAVNKLIQDVSQLQSSIDRINSKTLDIAPAKLQERANKLYSTMEGSAAKANDLGGARVKTLDQQRQAIERLTQAQNAQLRAIEAASAAEREISRRAQRDEIGSRKVSELKQNLAQSAAEAERFSEEITKASTSVKQLESRINAVRSATKNVIRTAGSLIDVNSTLAASNAISSLAKEYNKYGDSLKRSVRESQLTDRILPTQTKAFTDLKDQIEQTETSLAGLRNQLRQLGSMEAIVNVPARVVPQGELLNPQDLAAIAKVNEIQKENEARQQRNAARSRISGDIAAQERNLVDLEARASNLGRKITKNQDQLMRLQSNRNPAERSGLSTSLNQIQAQAESLALVANNSAIASTAFNKFTVGAEMASIKLARAQQSTFAALAAGFSGGGGVNIPQGLRQEQEIAGARNMVGQLIADIPGLTRSEAALNAHLALLNQIKAVLPFMSLEYRAVEEAVAGLNQELEGVGLRGQASKIDPGAGKRFLKQRQREEDQARKAAQNINNLFQKQVELTDAINNSRLSDDKKADLREKNERAINELIANRYENSKEMTRLLERQLKAENDLLKAKPPRVFGVLREDFMPVSGKMPSGEIIPGSPAAKKVANKEQEKALKDLAKYTEEASKQADKLQAHYDRLDLTKEIDKYLADLASFEQATAKIIKQNSMTDNGKKDALRDFDQRLKIAEETKKANGQLSSQLLQLQKLQKTLVEAEIDGVNVSENKAKVETLIESIKSGQIISSKASVDLVGREIKDARTLLGISQIQAKIDGKIADALKISVGGPSKKINDLAAQQKYAVQVNDAYQQTEELLAKIGKAAIPESQKLNLSFNIDQARNELYQNRLESAQLITRETEKQLKLETSLQATVSKQKLRGSSWSLAFAQAGEIRNQMGAEKTKEEIEASRILQQQLKSLLDIQNQYVIAEGKGVNLTEEKARLTEIITQLSSNQIPLTKAMTGLVGENIKELGKAIGYRKNEAIINKTYTGSGSGGGATTADQLEARRSRLLDVARSGLNQLISLEQKGVIVSEERLKIEEAINDIQAIRNKATKDELVALAQKVAAAKNFASDMQINLRTNNLPGVGLQASIQGIKQAKEDRQKFLGSMSPAEGIDKIVREFNSGASGSSNQRMNEVGSNAVSSYVNAIRAGIPNAAKAMKDVALASTRALMKALGMASPSKVMIEIATNLVNTYIDYLLKAIPEIENAANKIGEASVPDAMQVPNSLTTKARPGSHVVQAVSANYASLFGHSRNSVSSIETHNAAASLFSDYILKKGRIPDIEGIFGKKFSSTIDNQRAMGMSGTEEIKKLQQFLVDFYGITGDLANGIKGAASSAGYSEEEVKQLNKYINQLGAHFGDITNLIRASANMAANPSLGGARRGQANQFTEAARIAAEIDAKNAAEVAKRASISSQFEPSIQRASEIDAQNKKQQIQDAFAASRAQAEADAQAAAAAMSSLTNPIEDVLPEGQRKARLGLEQLFNQIRDFAKQGASIFAGGGGGRGGGGRGGRGGLPPAGGGDAMPPGDRGPAGRSQPAGADLLGLKSLSDISKRSTRELEALSSTFSEFRAVLDPTVTGFNKLDRELRDLLGGINRQLERRAPNANFLTRRVGPRAANAVSEGIIGGAFPLLFGQGIGSSVGGGLGGAAGGFAGGGLGFGLSLIGTALGGLFDQLNQAAQETGKSLNYPIEAFQKLKDANLLSSRAQEYYISKLIETGQTGKATAEIQAQMIKKIGVSGVNDLMALGDASTELSKVWAEFVLQLQAAIAGPMTDLLKFIASVLELSNKAGREEARRRTTFIGLSDADQKAVNERISKEIKARGGAEMVGIEGIQDIRDRILKEYSSKSAAPKANAPKEDFKTQEEALKAQRQVADDIKSAYREGFQIQQRGIDLQRKVIDIRRRIEEDIFNRQQEILRQQIDNDRKRSQVAIEAVTLEYQKRAANEEGRAAEVLAAEADVIKTRMQGESEIAASKKLLQLDIDKQQRQTQKYIYDLSREADSIRRETLSLEMEAADYRLKIDRQIQDQRLIVAAAEKSGAATVQATGSYTGTSVDGFPIGSRPGMRIHPLTGKLKDHKGVDIPMPVGTAIGYDVAGKVISTGVISGYGKTLEVELDNGVKAFSAHLSEVLVKVGDRFNANQLLAKSGATGGVTGPHLHQEGARGGDPYASLPNLQLGKAVTGVDAGVASAQAQLRRARSQVVDRPTVPALPVSEAAGTMQSLDASNNKARQEAIKIEQKMLKLKDDQALQRLYEVARGPIELKQRKEAVDLARAELNYIIPTSQNTQERLLFEVQVTERIKNRLETDRKILANKNLEVDVRKKLTEAIKEGKRILSEQIKLDGEALMIAQQRKILEPAAQQTNQIYQEIEARKLRNRLAMEGFAPEIIDGELRVLQLQKDLKEQVTTYDVRLARLTGTIYDGTSATYESASAKLKELEATSQLTDKQKELKNELQEILKARQNIKDKVGSAIGSARQAAKASILSPQEKLGKKIGELRTEINNLADPANQIISAADAIGSAFSESFKSIISGSSSAEEALGNFFQRTADNFLNMASQMIAKQIEMQVVGIGMNLLGGLFGGGSANTNLGSSSQNIAQYAPLPNAKGNAFTDSIQPFAMGGAFTNSILSSPTLFQFANGGTMNTGVAGESGPEAIMPLTRGPGGSLGVKAYLADSRAALQGGSQGTDNAAFTDNRQAMEAASAAFADNRQAMEKTSATYKERFVESVLSSTPATTEIKYTRVGSGDLPFVTEENMLQATRIAAQEGAKMGERRTLTALRNNPATRRTIGI